MLRHTSLEAAEAMPQVKLSRIFNLRPLFWKILTAVGLVASVVGFSMLQAESYGFWLQRIRLSETPWPRRVQLSVVGFQQLNGQLTVNVARDDDFELQVEASIEDGHLAPASVEIRYRLQDGRRGRDTMTKIGAALPGRDSAQQFRYTFKNVVSDLHFDLIGDDDRIYNLKLHVVERPQIEQMSIACEYPAYLQRPPEGIFRKWPDRTPRRNSWSLPFYGQQTIRGSASIRPFSSRNFACGDCRWKYSGGRVRF